MSVFLTPTWISREAHFEEGNPLAPPLSQTLKRMREVEVRGGGGGVCRERGRGRKMERFGEVEENK